jgi:hypothetical protein
MESGHEMVITAEEEGGSDSPLLDLYSMIVDCGRWRTFRIVSLGQKGR